MANHLVARLLRLLLLWALLLMLWLSFGATSNVAAFLAPLSSLSTATSTRIPGAGLVEGRGSHLAAETAAQHEFALLFDCDGVILETEELHRLAYNHAFREFDLTIDGEPVVWSEEYYDILQNTVGGGIPKMNFHFRETAKAYPSVAGQPAPTTDEAQQRLVAELQAFKTNHYKTLLATEAVARPGVLELMDAALADPTIAVGVCSAATKAAAVKTLDLTLGPERVQRLDVCILGDDVSAKKPDPLIYNTARERLNLSSSSDDEDPCWRCIVIEDSLVGLRAAVAAHMKCLITYTSSTASQDFYGEGAAATVPDLSGVTLDTIFGPLREHGKNAEMLVGIKD